MDKPKISVNVHNEWDSLKVVLLGRIDNAIVPTVKDKSLHCINYPHLSDEVYQTIPCGPYPQQILEETAEDLENFAAQLRNLGIQVVRPKPIDTTRIYHTKHWAVDGYYTYCPRDTILTIGNKAIAAPMVMRHRQNEYQAYRHLFSSESWVEAPKPILQDNMYERHDLTRPTLMNHEPAFDAANVMKCHQDIWFLISNTGNEKGAEWLQNYLGSDYHVHKIPNIYLDMHIDTTFIPLREGLVCCNPARVNRYNIPSFLKKWEIIYAPEMIEQPYLKNWGPASSWIGMNILSLAPDFVAIEESQIPLMKALKRYGIDSMPFRLRHARTLGGGPHCITCDLRREV